MWFQILIAGFVFSWGPFQLLVSCFQYDRDVGRYLQPPKCHAEIKNVVALSVGIVVSRLGTDKLTNIPPVAVLQVSSVRRQVFFGKTEH